MAHDPYRALYIHIPFCTSRCAYCDFATEALPSTSPKVGSYIEDIILDVRHASKEGELTALESVYVGGGTPTHIGSRHLTQMLYTLGVSMKLTADVECTVEANPESLSAPLVKDLFSLGVNRLSLGVQSFDDDLLRTLGRPHSAADALRALEQAKLRFSNISVDLMCGLPGQTLESFARSIETALGNDVQHVSIYPLTIESGTPFAKALRRGRLELCDEDTQADMMELAEQMLRGAGMHRYEVANYCLPGYESVHNSSYWEGKPYLGIGRSAVTMTQNHERRMRVQDGIVIDDLTPRQMAAEDVMLAMRMAKGVEEEAVARYTELLPELPQTLAHLQELGLVASKEGRWQPTERGWICGNELYGALLDLAP